MPIPDIPGSLIPRHSEQERWLKGYVADMCRIDNPEKFPGSQPVSFAVRDLAKLESQDYWVCEKSDGVRVLFLIATNLETKEQSTFLIDRHNTYRQLTGLYFPHYEFLEDPLRNTLLDGELVLDVDKATGREQLRFLAFDCLVIDGENVMGKTLDKRYGRLDLYFYKPYQKMMKDHPHMANTQPFEIRVKEINFSYHVEKVFNVDIPALQHENDGLIYTCVTSPYIPGTDNSILKWKPPSENSIDFKLVLRFPPSRYNPREPDWHAKPVFLLHVWCGGPKYEMYDDMYVTDEEWEDLKRSGEQIDDRIVEVHWDPALSRWRMMRFRDDKPNGNHRSVVENIIQSIADGVEKDVLLERCMPIKHAWKLRMGQPSQPMQSGGGGGPPASSYPPPNQAMRPPPLPPQKIASRPPGPPIQHQQQSQYPQQQAPSVQYRYGPLATSPWSKVAGPAVVAGMKR